MSSNRIEKLATITIPPRSDPGSVLVSAHTVLHDLRRRDGYRGFVLFAAFFAVYTALVYRRFDASMGGESIEWLHDAVEDEYQYRDEEGDSPWCRPGTGLDCLVPYTSLGSVDDLRSFVDTSLARYLRAVRDYCPACSVGITRLPYDIEDMVPGDFICVDFEVAPEGRGLLPRDCPVANAAWRAAPSLGSSPCCDDGDLARASLALTAGFLDDGLSERPLNELRALYGSGAATARYVDEVLDTTGVIAQLVIRRGNHVVGVLFRADRRSPWLPGRVETSLQHWSYNFEAGGVSAALTALAVCFWALSLAHEALRVLAETDGRMGILAHFASPYVLIVQLPGIVLPFVLEAARRELTVNEYALIVSAVELLLLARLFQEGRHLPAFGGIVRTLALSLRELASVCAVLVVCLAVLAAIYVQLFGAFDPAYRSYWGAVVRVFTVAVQGSDYDSPGLDHSPAAWTIMHLVSNVLVYTILAQLVIAVLVGAYDQMREEAKERARLKSLADSFAPAAKRPTLRRRVEGVLLFAFAHQLYGDFSFRVARGVRAAVRAAAQEADADASGMKRTVSWRRHLAHAAHTGHVMLSRDLLDEALGPTVAERLVDEYGVVLPPKHLSNLSGADAEGGAPDAALAHQQQRPASGGVLGKIFAGTA